MKTIQKKTKSNVLENALSTFTKSQSRFDVGDSIPNKITTLIKTGSAQHISTAHLKTFLTNCGIDPNYVETIIKDLKGVAEVATSLTIDKKFYDETLSKLFAAVNTGSIDPHYQTILKELKFASNATELNNYFSGVKKDLSDNSLKLALVGLGIIKEEDYAKPLKDLFPEYPYADRGSPGLLLMSLKDKFDLPVEFKAHPLYEKTSSLVEKSRTIKNTIRDFREKNFEGSKFTDESIRLLLLGLGVIDVKDLETDLNTILELKKTVSMTAPEKMKFVIALVKKKGDGLKPLLPEAKELLPVLQQWDEIKKSTNKVMGILGSSDSENKVSDKELILTLVGMNLLPSKCVNYSLKDLENELPDGFKNMTSFGKDDLITILKRFNAAPATSPQPIQKEGLDLLALLSSS